MRRRFRLLTLAIVGLFILGTILALVLPHGREAVLYGFQAVVSLVGLSVAIRVRWLHKIFWVSFVGLVGLGDAIYWLFNYSSLKALNTPYRYFFCCMLLYLVGTLCGTVFLFLKIRGRTGSRKFQVIDWLPGLLVLAISSKFVLLPIFLKVWQYGLDISTFGYASYGALSIGAILVCLRVLVLEESPALLACAMGLLVQSLVNWGIEVEYLVDGALQFTFFDIVWFSSVFVSVLAMLEWPENSSSRDAKNPELGINYQLRHWLLALVLVPLTILSFLQAFNPKAVSVVSMAVLGGVIFVWVASRVLIHQIRSSSELRTLSATVQIAGQVAHDIRSPLAALEVLMGSADKLPEDESLLMRAAVTRIREIANGMLKKNKEALERTRNIGAGLNKIEFVPSSEPIRSLAINEMVSALLAEKRLHAV